MEKYQIVTGHHGYKDAQGNTIIVKPGDAVLLDKKRAQRFGVKVREWPDDLEWPGEGVSSYSTPQTATLKTTQAAPTVKPAKPGDTHNPHAVSASEQRAGTGKG